METKVKNHGEILKEFFTVRRISQREVCKLLGFAPSNFETTLMREKINIKHQIKLKEMYGIDLDNYNEMDAITQPLLREKGIEYSNNDPCEKRLAEKEEIIGGLKSQLKDKDTIIALMKELLEKNQK
jgi:hypothetical protein